VSYDIAPFRPPEFCARIMPCAAGGRADLRLGGSLPPLESGNAIVAPECEIALSEAYNRVG